MLNELQIRFITIVIKIKSLIVHLFGIISAYLIYIEKIIINSHLLSQTCLQNQNIFFGIF